MSEPGVTAEQVRRRLREADGLGPLAKDRLDFLASLGRDDLALAKIVEPHLDAASIVGDLGGPAIDPGSVWAVWAAEPPFAVLKASSGGGTTLLSGAKAFCSGWGIATHALVTAATDEGSAMFAVRTDSAIVVDDAAPAWAGPGMRRAHTRTLRFNDVPAISVGEPGAYTNRPGFWHGAIGIAAIWAGGSEAVAGALDRARDRLGPHGFAHLGAVRAALAANEAMLDRAGRWIDSRPTEPARRIAEETRAVIADHARLVSDHAARALGPGPLVADADHATRVGDLAVFVLQHHAERDLEALGRLP